MSESHSGRDSARQALVDAARDLARTRGYNAFSFRDLSEIVGITTASIHYHFPTKADLGRELAIQYRQRMLESMRQIESRTTEPHQRLERLVALLKQSSKKGTSMCLCGMFAAEFSTLPDAVRAEVRVLFEACEVWIAGVIRAGQSLGAFSAKGSPERLAQGVFAALQGGMLAACAFEDETRVDAVAEPLLVMLGQE